MRSLEEVTAELDQAKAEDRAKNGLVYPKGSLHYNGVMSPGCDTCQRITILSWVLNKRPSSKISKDEQKKHLVAADAFADKAMSFARANDW